jgi:PEP-CTERM motif-containing protein
MSNIRRGITLEKKLAAYSLAGAAAFIAPGAAKADVIYVPNVDTFVNQTGSYDFNLTGPSSDDITLTAQAGMNGSDPANEIEFSAGTGAAVMVDEPFPFSINASDLAFAALIDPTSPTNWGTSGKLVSYDTSANTVNGDWPLNGDTGYLGFYFGAVGSPQAGWAQISTTDGPGGASFEVLDYAYETTPNTPINAGQVPEPSALPLLILGGAGLIALRRRRAAHA